MCVVDFLIILGKPVHEMHWMHRTEAFVGCLMVLHSPGLLVLLNAETGVRLWRTSFHDPLISFALDPFDMHSMAGKDICQRLLFVIFNVGLTSKSLGSVFQFQLSFIF